MQKPVHITLLTDARYVKRKPGDWYIENIFREDDLLTAALERRGIVVERTAWDDPQYDWSQTQYAIFRTTWDYFDRFEEFAAWLEATEKKTKFLNPLDLVRWNMDKHYLNDLAKLGVHIPPTVFVERGDPTKLGEWMERNSWAECVVKPAVGGAGRHTYRVNRANLPELELIFAELIANEAMLVQAFLHNVPAKGEITLMVFEGRYSHAVLKKAKAGDFRVQDDFGGTVYPYEPHVTEIALAESVVGICSPLPIYARVDMVWDNEDQLCVSELEMIEPELWMRNFPESAELFAAAIVRKMQS